MDVVDADARWCYLQHLPPAVLLTAADTAAAAVLRAADVVVLQLQQPLDAVLAAADLARDGGATVVLDGAAPDPSAREALLSRADVLRADGQEARSWTDAPRDSADTVLAAARELVGTGPSLVVLDAGKDGNAAAWPGGADVVPLLPADVVDPTGSGDAYIAALDRGPAEAVRWAAAAAACTVEHLSGRPALSPEVLAARLARGA